MTSRSRSRRSIEVPDSSLLAPAEGEASTPDEIADELCDALNALDHVDYNALNVDELRELLEARETIETICLHHRRMHDPREG